MDWEPGEANLTAFIDEIVPEAFFYYYGSKQLRDICWVCRQLARFEGKSILFQNILKVLNKMSNPSVTTAPPLALKAQLKSAVWDF